GKSAVIIRARSDHYFSFEPGGNTMTDQKDSSDARADAIATTAIVTIVIATVVYWLAGMPS
nr:hypothetical protein [Halieaceae bacterium]